MRFLQGSLDYSSSSLKLEDIIITKKGERISILRNLFTKNLFPYEYFISNDDYYQPIDHLNKEHLNNISHSPHSERIERTFEIFKKYNIKDGKEVPLLFLKLEDVTKSFRDIKDMFALKILQNSQEKTLILTFLNFMSI